MTAIPNGFYTDSNYWGFIGYDPYGYIARHNPGTFMVKGNRLYMKFATESEYIDWWQENFTEYWNKELKEANQWMREQE